MAIGELLDVDHPKKEGAADRPPPMRTTIAVETSE